MYSFCNSRTHIITLYSGHICYVLCVNVSVLTTRMDPGWMSELVSEPYEYNTTLTAIFLKTNGEDTLQCPYKDYSSLYR
jgi:hypothetical protein